MKLWLSNTGLKAIISRRDFLRCREYNWRLGKNGYVVTKIEGKETYLHVFILQPKEGEFVDHKFHNKLDCRRSYLRICSKSQNGMNQRKTRGISKYKGVSWFPRDNCWVVKIKLNRKQIHIGYFTNEEQAGKAYDRFAIALFGVFAKTNFL